MGQSGSMNYYRPLLSSDPARPSTAQRLAGGWLWFDRVQVLRRDAPPTICMASDLPQDVLYRLTSARPDLAGLALDEPRLMGILNVTPDSFSDGGRFLAADAAIVQARQMAMGADILDIGGESTRPGAALVSEEDEISRTAPVIQALRAAGVQTPISIDTRKAGVADAALKAGATIVNDVAGLTFDPALGPLMAARAVPVILMHAKGTPDTMQVDPRYDHVLLDVYDWLAEGVDRAVAFGIPRENIVVDPGIGFGKTVAHNLALIRGLALFHGLGCPVLLGASRKRFIGTLAGEDRADHRMPGSVAIALAGVAQGAQVIRIHDVAETRQALTLWQAATTGELA